LQDFVPKSAHQHRRKIRNRSARSVLNRGNAISGRLMMTRGGSCRLFLFACGLTLALPALAQGFFDPRTSRTGQRPQDQEQGQQGQASSRPSTELLPISSPQAPVITNALHPASPAVPEVPQRALPEAGDRIEFQDFVLQSTGRDLPLFGAELFRQPPSTFAPVDNIPVTADYVIGPGDEILIRAWGQIDVDFAAIVDRNGTINVPKVGTMSVAGVKYQDLPGYLKTAFGRVFRNFELTVTLGRLRSIQIFVVGQARRPGTYTVSSLSTLVTALFAVGGPSAKGSMRSIQLKRGNQVVADLDLYDLLVSGDKSRDAQLLPGDVVYIPPVGPLAAITGSVNVPAIYELKPRAPLFDVIKWAGGLATTAQGQKVSLERIEERRTRTVEELPLDISGLSREIRDGDLLTVHSLVPRFENAVTLRGNVAYPGRFPWREGMRVRDLIPDKEALLSRDYWERRNRAVGIDEKVARIAQEATGLGIADLAEKRQQNESDTLADSIRRRLVEQEAAKLSAPGQRLPGPVPLISQIRPVKEINWEYAVVERVKPDDLTTTLIPFNLGKVVLEDDPQQNLELRPGDIVTVFSKEDLQVPASKQTKFVRLEGEFVAAGVYQVQPAETLRQLVSRVGGLAPDAYLFGAEFTRESTRLQQQKRLDEALDRLEREIQSQSVTRAQNVLSGDEAQSLAQQAASQQALLARLRQLKATGRISLELPEEANLKDLPDMPFEDGDRFFIPQRPSMVSVIGAVYNETSFVYKPDKRVADYLSQAGGPTSGADKGSIYLLRADGSVISRRNSGFIFSALDNARVMPGDAIVVPEELDRTTLTRNLKDWTQIFFQFGLGAAALRVISNR
jgi:protein involved in polysaccharide export with SLBB domain